jgi:hypothetical protein
VQTQVFILVLRHKGTEPLLERHVEAIVGKKTAANTKLELENKTSLISKIILIVVACREVVDEAGQDVIRLDRADGPVM